jgi:hypothetical protein
MGSRALAAVLLAACGRVGFDGRLGGDASVADAPSAPPAWVGTVVARDLVSGSSDSFAAQAHAANNVFLIYVSCVASPNASTFSVTAPGWTIMPLSAIVAPASGVWSAQLFGAIAPDTAPVTFSLGYGGVFCSGSSGIIADELTGVAVIDAAVQTIGVDDCIATLTTNRTGDLVWGTCFSATSLVGTGTGYTVGSNDNDGDLSEYRVTADPSGTLETVTFLNPPGEDFTLAAVALAPR